MFQRHFAPLSQAFPWQFSDVPQTSYTSYLKKKIQENDEKRKTNQEQDIVLERGDLCTT